MKVLRLLFMVLLSGFAVSSCNFQQTENQNPTLSWAVVEHENPYSKLDFEYDTTLEHPLVSLRIPKGWSAVFRESGTWQPPAETQLFSIIDISPSEQIKSKYSALLNKDSLTFIQIVVQGKYQPGGSSGPPLSFTKAKKAGIFSGNKYVGSTITNGLLITMTAHSHFWNTFFGEAELKKVLDSIKITTPPQVMNFSPKRSN